MSNRTVEIDVILRDQTNNKLNNLKKQLDQLDAQAQRLSNRFRALALQKFATTIRLIDKVTEPASRINSLLKRLAGTAYRVSIRLNDGALSGIRKIESALMKISGRVYNVAVNVKGTALSKLNSLASGALMAAGSFMPGLGALGGGYLIGNAIKSAVDFEKQMSKVAAVRQLDKNSPEMKLLTEDAKHLGATTAWTRKQVAEAQWYQALAGWSTQEIHQATPHVLNLASASDVSLDKASDILTDAMTAFNLKATDKYTNRAGKSIAMPEYFSDMMAKLQASSNTDLLEMREAFKYGAPTIGAMFANVQGQEGIQLRTEAARQMMIMTGAMANAGIKGSQAGTGINTLFNRLAGQNRNTFFAERLLGLEHAKDGEMRMPLDFVKAFKKRMTEGMNVDDFYQVAEELAGEKIHADTKRKLNSTIENALKNGGKLGSEDILKMSSMLAGLEHMPKLLAMAFQDLDALEQKMTNVEGTAGDMANTQLDNLAGSFIRLDSAWDAFSQDLFTTTAGDGLRNFVDALTEIITRAQNLFKDGIDIPDIAKILGDIIGRLKNKFLELDGVGSILAGGALFMGLRKIAGLAQNITTSMRTIGKNGNFGVNSAQKIGTMTISAGVVHVNGKISGSGFSSPKVGNQAIIDNYYRTRANFTPSLWSRVDKGAAGGAMAFAGIFSMLDILSMKSINAERLAAAPESERAQILRENRQAEWLSGGGALGAIAFAGLGAALGSIAGPLGTSIGAIVGGMIGEKLGQIAGLKGAEISKDTTDEANRWNLNRGTSSDFATTGTDSAERFQEKLDKFSARAVKIWNGTLEDETKLADIGAGVAQRRVAQAQTLYQQYQAEQTALTATKDQMQRFSNIRANLEADLGQAVAEQKFLATNPSLDYYAQQRDFMKQGFFSGSFPDFSFGSRAEAAELNDEQMAQMAAMERGEFYQPEAISEQIAAQNEAILESFSGLGEQITESLTSSLEGAGEVFSTFGESITEGLTSTFEGAGEVLSNFGETISTGLQGAQEITTASLESIQNSFTNAKLTIESTWNELPGFFSGIFSGLGGAAEAAGSAIAAGLTSPIGSVIGAWQSAAAQISSIISSISAQAAAVPSSAGAIPAHAEGGFVTSPEISLIGEQGPELILPLTDRQRSMELLNQASSILGLNSTDSNFSSSGENSSSQGITINLGGVNFNISSDSPSEIMNTLTENIQELSDKIAATLAQNIQSSHKNMPLTN